MEFTLLHVGDSKRRNRLTFFLAGTDTPADGTKQSDGPGKTDKEKKKTQAGQERG